MMSYITKTENIHNPFEKNQNISFLIISGYILENILKINKINSTLNNYDKSIFDSEIHLNSSISDYVFRLNIFLKIDKNMLILTLMNLDKFMNSNKKFKINQLNCHKLYLACLIETLKFYDDFIFPNKTFCLLGLISPEELLSIEKAFLEAIGYNLYVSDYEFFSYQEKLEKIFFSNKNKDIQNFNESAIEIIIYLNKKCYPDENINDKFQNLNNEKLLKVKDNTQRIFFKKKIDILVFQNFHCEKCDE